MAGSYNKAKGEPRMTLDDMAAVVATIMALTDDAVIALDLLAEGVFTTREYDTHGEVVAGSMCGRDQTSCCSKRDPCAEFS